MTLSDQGNTPRTFGEVEHVEVGVGSIHMRGESKCSVGSIQGESKRWYVTIYSADEFGAHFISAAAARRVAAMLNEAADEAERR
jgi:hypothetical protein